MARGRIFMSIAVISIILNIVFLLLFKSNLLFAAHSFLSRHYNNNRAEINSVTIDTEYSSYCNFDTIESVNLSRNVKNAVELPDQLVVKPGVYKLGNNVIDMNKEGLYRLLFPGYKNYQVIVYKDNIMSLLSSIAWIHTHGDNDDPNRFSDLCRIATRDKLYLTCSYISKFSRKLMGSLGIKTRIVKGMTLNKWNDFDNGHVLLEVFHPGLNKWILADIDNNRLFTEGSSDTLLSFVEMHRALYNNSLKFKVIAKDIRVDISRFKAENGISYNFMMERLNTDEMKLNWYKKVCEVVIIENNFYNSKDIQRLTDTSPSYSYLDSSSFIAKYYEGPSGNAPEHRVTQNYFQQQTKYCQ